MAENGPRVVISAGEASGDLQGAYLAAALKRMSPALRISGIGGRKMREAGVELLFDSTSWAAIGLAQSLKLVPKLLAVLRQMKRVLDAGRPDLVVLIDFGAFNARLGRFLHERGIKALYYFPPGSWNRNQNCERLIGVADRFVTPFPWSAERLRLHGLSADFFGHPLLDIVKPTLSRQDFCSRFGFDADKPIVGLLPGSRPQELEHNLPPMLACAAQMTNIMPDLQFVIPCAQSVDPVSLADEIGEIDWLEVDTHISETQEPHHRPHGGSLRLERNTGKLMKTSDIARPETSILIRLLSGMNYDVLAHSRAAVVGSGTATVEAAILGCPMVIAYRGDWLTTLEYKLKGGRKKLIGMPNIILNRRLCHELVAEGMKPEPLAALTMELVHNSPAREDMISGLAEVRSLLGEPGAVDKTAHIALDMLKSDTRNGK